MMSSHDLWPCATKHSISQRNSALLSLLFLNQKLVYFSIGYLSEKQPKELLGCLALKEKGNLS